MIIHGDITKINGIVKDSFRVQLGAVSKIFELDSNVSRGVDFSFAMPGYDLTQKKFSRRICKIKIKVPNNLDCGINHNINSLNYSSVSRGNIYGM